MANEDNNRIQALLKEWGLCQDDANAQNHWAWQIGAILIALSLAAMWIQFQIEESNRFAYSVPLGIFSIVTILIWDFWIVVRARFFINLAYRRARDLEHEIGQLCYGDARGEFHHPHPWRRDEGPTHILHTFIDEEDARA